MTIQHLFNKISLAENSALWLSDDNSDEKNEERFHFLASQTNDFFRKSFDAAQSPALRTTRKSAKLSQIMEAKADEMFAAKSPIEGVLWHYNQSLTFADDICDVIRIMQKRIFLFINQGKKISASHMKELKIHLNDFTSGEKSSLRVEILKMVCNSLPVSNNSLQKPSKIQQLPKLDCENAVRVEFEEKSGRFCRAAKPIKRGSVIGVQKPHVSILDEEETSEKCWHCFSKLESPVPCSGCSSVLFCGSQCRKAADEKYHRWECGLLDIFHLSKLGAWSLAYRAIIQENKETFKGEAFDEKFGRGILDLSPNESKSLRLFANLVSHGNSSRKKAPELMMQALVTVFFLRALHSRGYFGPKSSFEANLSAQDLMFCNLIHRFMRIVFYNTHEISASKSSKFNAETIRIGRGTFASLALFNHSCNPNYRRINVGQYIVAVAIRDIKENEEICDGYTLNYSNMSKKERSERLDKYEFECGCVACSNNWGTFNTLKESCGRSSDDDEQIKEAEKAVTSLRSTANPEPDKMLDASVDFFDKVSKVEKHPHQKAVLAETFLYDSLLYKFARP